MEASTKIDIDAKIKEAEVYYSMGLLDESLGAYEQVLRNVPEMGDTHPEDIQEKIEKLKKEIAIQDEVDSRSLSAKDISNFKKTVRLRSKIWVFLQRLLRSMKSSSTWITRLKRPFRKSERALLEFIRL